MLVLILVEDASPAFGLSFGSGSVEQSSGLGAIRSALLRRGGRRRLPGGRGGVQANCC